jgi:hypothetical protein
MVRATTVLVACMLFVVPCTAWSQAPQTNAPPGNSGIDEYLETVPSAGGDKPSQPAAQGGAGNGSSSSAGGQSGPSGNGGSGGAKLSPAERKRLDQLGPDGKALADVVDATSPGHASAQPDGTTAKPFSTAPVAGEGRSPLSEALRAAVGLDGGGAMGFVLPATLLASLIGLVGLAVVRRRSFS